jgi:hypothetical protein
LGSFLGGPDVESQGLHPTLTCFFVAACAAQIFPVKLTQEAIFVDVTGAKFARAADARGGSRTSAENNNVFSVSVLQPHKGNPSHSMQR